MMKTITLRSQVGPDGILHLDIPVDMENTTSTDLEVTVTIRAISSGLERNSGVELGWPEGFLVETAGSIPDLERPPQGDYDLREAL
jgi:hypothetical protein